MENVARAACAIEALVRELNLRPGNPPPRILIPLTSESQQLLEEFGRAMQPGGRMQALLLKRHMRGDLDGYSPCLWWR